MTRQAFKQVNPKVSFPALEEEILKYWKENKIFEKSITSRSKEKTWTFLDGPPFVTGLPHYGSLLSSLPKDLFGRYWTMKGYRVRRVWGWDGHGLPIENKVETKLAITRKKDIEEKVGVKKFIEECRQYVGEVSDEWEWYVDRIGRWVDFKNAYRTWDRDYMESVMWVFKQMYEKEYIYKGLRVSLYCPHCATPISNFEVAMDADNYKDVPDPSTVYKYPLKGEKDTYILAWSTTPWNKIVTPALAVNPKLTYVRVKQGNEYYILAKSTLKMLKPQSNGHSGLSRIDSGVADAPQNDGSDDYQIIEEFKGSELIGKQYVPHYDYYKIDKGKKAFVIIPGDFVTAEEGTGVVTIAAYGEEDLKSSLENNIHIEMHVDEEGMIKKDVPFFGGMYYLKANKAVNDDLKTRELIYKDEEITHSVPLCWRCHTRLYYAPQDAWYVDVGKLKPRLKQINEKINWFPKHFKYGRFLKSLESAPDWNISRSRYWGSPVPVWECECGERFVPGSIRELEERSKRKINDLHKPEIDEVTIMCSKCGKTARRVPEVLDSWIEAGSASFAERHFPFAGAQGKPLKLEDFFPPDFVAEYTGQIRAWFHVLHVIAGALYDSSGFKNVLVTGVILGNDGRKMSKNYGNYPDPKEMLQKYGGDALRLYLMGSPVMHGEDILISEDKYRLQVRGMMLILWNTYNFFVTYVNLDKWDSGQARMTSKNVLDRWILSLLNRLISEVTKNLEKFDTVSAIEKMRLFVDNLSTWYIRRSRDRVGPSAEKGEDKDSFYQTAYTVLKTIAKVLAPITPFITDEIYKNLTAEESVHLTDWPKSNSLFINIKLEEEMELARKIVEFALAKRKENQIRVRQTLSLLTVTSPNIVSESIGELIKDEVNVQEIISKKGDKLEVVLNTEITRELKALGEARDIVRQIQEERKKLGTRLDEYVVVSLSDWPRKHEDYIKRNALVKEIIKGEFSVKQAK